MSFTSIKDKVSVVARTCVEKHLGDQEVYHASKVQELAQLIPSKVTEDLEKDMPKGFKFVVTCSIQPKGDSFGIHASNACLWDNSSDGSCMIQWENSAVFCLVNVFGIKI